MGSRFDRYSQAAVTSETPTLLNGKFSHEAGMFKLDGISEDDEDELDMCHCTKKTPYGDPIQIKTQPDGCSLQQ